MILSKKINKLGGGGLNKWIRLAKKRKKWKLTLHKLLGTGEYIRHFKNKMLIILGR